MLLCAAAFTTSCNEDFDDWASPQANEQGSDAATYGITVTPGAQANIVMDNTTEFVDIANIAASSEDVASVSIKKVTVNGVTLPATLADGVITVSAAQLDSIVEITTLDRSATPHTIDIVADINAQLATGEAVSLSITSPATLTPFTANIPEKDAKGYAMLGQWQGWDPSNPTWMTEVEPGVYQAEIVTTAEENWFKFYKGSGFDEASFPWDDVALGCAVNGDATSPNLLVWAGDPRFGGFQTPTIAGAAAYVVTLDMNKFYYKYELKEKKYYVVGVPNGWSDQDKNCLFYALGGNQYSYTTYWPNQWSLKIWDEDTFGNWDAAWGGVDGSTDATGTLVNSNAGAFGASETGGYYTLTINMGTKSYEWTAVAGEPATYEAIGIIGGFNEWSSDVEMTQLEKAPHNWYARHTLTSDTELKFRANHAWDVNWGGDGSAAISEDVYYTPVGGSNIAVPAGTYDFYLNDITGQFCIVLVAE